MSKHKPTTASSPAPSEPSTTTLTRKQRRSQKQTHPSSVPDLRPSEIPLKRPDRHPRQDGTPTLVDLARKRQAELDGRPSSSPDNDTNPQDSPSDQPEDMPPSLTAFTYGLTLSMLNFTLDILIHHQYGQLPLPYLPLLYRSLFPVFPCIALVMFVLHSHAYGLGAYPRLREAVCFLASVGAGCYAVQLGNEGAYLRVLRRASGVGTVWVGGTVVLGRWAALGSACCVVGWAGWRGNKFW